jgi:lysophospholipase L1-like esterase
MRTNALGASVFLGVFLLPVLCFAQSLHGPYQCEGGLGRAAPYLHPGPNKCGSGSGYVGPGDAAVVAGLGNATDFGSCTYAYNSAYATGSNPACSLRRADGQTCTVLIGKNGLVDVSVGTPCTGTGPAGTTGASTATQFCASTTCYVSTVYNQRGANNFVNMSNNPTQPVFHFNAIRSLPAIQCSQANNTFLSATVSAGTQPYTYSYVGERTLQDTSNGFTTGTFNGTTGSELGWEGGTNDTTLLYAGAVYNNLNILDTYLHAFGIVLSGSSGATTIDGTSTTSINIGSLADSSTLAICNRGALDASVTGIVGEVGRWVSAATPTQATKLCGNQNLRWGVLSSPYTPAGNVICATPKLTLVAHGDSITYGYGLVPSSALAYPNVLSVDLTNNFMPSTAYNFGDISAGFTYAGSSGYSLDQSAPIWVDPYASNPTARLIIFAGTNGLNVMGATGASVFSDFLTYFNARLAAGWTAKDIIVVEALPRNAASPDETNREAYNALLSSNAPTYGYQEVPLGTDTVMGQAGQWSNTTYYQDGIHPTAVGQALLASDMFGPTASCAACPGIH